MRIYCGDDDWDDWEEEEPTIEGIGYCDPLYDHIGNGDNNMNLLEKGGLTKKDIRAKLEFAKDIQSKIEVYYKGLPCMSFHHSFIILDNIKKYGFHYRGNIDDAIVGILTQEEEYFEYNTSKEPYYIVIKQRMSTKDKWETVAKFGSLPKGEK